MTSVTAASPKPTASRLPTVQLLKGVMDSSLLSWRRCDPRCFDRIENRRQVHDGSGEIRRAHELPRVTWRVRAWRLRQNLLARDAQLAFERFERERDRRRRGDHEPTWSRAGGMAEKNRKVVNRQDGAAKACDAA